MLVRPAVFESQARLLLVGEEDPLILADLSKLVTELLLLLRQIRRIWIIQPTRAI